MKRKPWKIVLGLTATMGLLLGLLVGDAHRRASATMAWHHSDLEEKAARYRARDHTRPSPFLETTEGNAWDYYGPAFQEIEGIPSDLADLIPEIQGSMSEDEFQADDHAIYNLLLLHRSAIAAIERGARCRTVDLPGVPLEPSWDFPHLGAELQVARFLTGAVSHSHRLGMDREALGYARLALARAQDIGRPGLLVYPLVQGMSEWIGRDAIRTLLEDHSLSVLDLAEFAAWLDRLEAARPDPLDAWAGEDVYARSAILKAKWEDLADNSKAVVPPPSWRCFFSRDITRAQALNLYSGTMQKLEGLRSLPPWRRIEVARSEFKDPKTSDNPFLSHIAASVTKVLERAALGQLGRTLMRVAVAIAWYERETGRYPALLEDLTPKYMTQIPVCPLTGLPFVHRNGKVWSVGKNRVDDRGVEDPLDNEGDGGDRGDVVWTVRRRK